MLIFSSSFAYLCACLCTLTDLDFQNTATAHHSSQPMDTLIHSQQLDTQHQTTAGSTAATANKVCSSCARFSFRVDSCYTITILWLSGLPGWASTRKVKPIWILLKQETVSGWAICKSALRPRQITMPALHHLVFYRPDGLPATHPTASRHWRQCLSSC